MKIIKTMLFAVLIGIAPGVFAKTIEMDVNGLVCAFCAQGIEKTLNGFPATEKVFVGLEHRIVAVELKDGQDIDDAALKKAITDAGYGLVRVRRTDESIAAIRARVSTREGTAEGRPREAPPREGHAGDGDAGVTPPMRTRRSAATWASPR